MASGCSEDGGGGATLGEINVAKSGGYNEPNKYAETPVDATKNAEREYRGKAFGLDEVFVDVEKRARDADKNERVKLLV
jgi:hypothetical protein